MTGTGTLLHQAALALFCIGLAAAARPSPPAAAPPPHAAALWLAAPEVVAPDSTFDVALSFSLPSPARAALQLRDATGRARPVLATPIDLPAGNGTRRVRVALPPDLVLGKYERAINLTATLLAPMAAGAAAGGAPSPPQAAPAAASTSVAVLFGPPVPGLFWDYPTTLAGCVGGSVGNHGSQSNCAKGDAITTDWSYQPSSNSRELDLKTGVASACDYSPRCRHAPAPPTFDALAAGGRGLNCSAYVALLDTAAAEAAAWLETAPGGVATSMSDSNGPSKEIPALADADRYLKRVRANFTERRDGFMAAAAAARAANPGTRPPLLPPEWGSPAPALTEAARKLRPPYAPC